MIKNYLEESISLKQKILNNQQLLDNLSSVIDLLNRCFNRGGKILIAGNGGSAADAQHFAAEIIGRYKLERRSYPAIALNVNSSIMTAIGNDYDYSSIFSRQVEGLAKENDIFFGISTSGNSKNIIEAVKKAKQIGLKTVGLLGNDGGSSKELFDISLVIPSNNTPRIQEIHIAFVHIICEELEKNFKLN